MFRNGNGKPGWRIDLKAIGPFRASLSCQLSMKKYRAAIYAGNGIGKTTLSRAFRFAELNEGASKSDCLITMGSNRGYFRFAITGSSDRPNRLEIDFRSGATPLVQNDTGYLFHVFNNDYVAENLAATSFQPSGKIDGYIVGKHEIDLDAEKQRLEELRRKGVELKSDIEQAIDVAKSELRANGISSNMTGYKNFSYGVLLETTACPDNYDKTLASLRALSEIPEDASSPAPLPARYTDFDFSALTSLLSTSFSKADLAAEFLEEIRRKLSFVEAGMSIQKDDKCPFCGQPYDDSAHRLIADYDRYLHDQEKAVIDRITLFESKLRLIVDVRNAAVSAYLQAEKTFDQYKRGFSDLDSVTFGELAPSELIDKCVTGILEVLDAKRADVSQPVDCKYVADLKGFTESDESSFERANEGIALLAKKLSSVAREKTSLRKDLCNNSLIKCRNYCDSLVCEVLETRDAYRRLQAQITSKEAQGKRLKRDAVSNLFEKLMAQVFGDKYSFDPESFSIRLGDNNLGSNAGMILSDGEKSLVAFCFYVASTYTLLEKDEDADRLFFVIDDPISSMDYHHVYEIAQIIRSLGDRFDSGGGSRLRFLLLTHNVAFFNLLAGSKIATDLFLMDKGGITPCDGRVIAPYSEHLADLKRVCDGEQPTHTTGNSIRQVLESLMHFEKPTMASLFNYLNEPDQADLKKAEYIYTLCNDQSHGDAFYGQEQPIDPEDIRRACQVVVEHVQRKYPGQLEALT